MWSSSPRPGAYRLALAIAGALGVSAAYAAETYVQPLLEVGVKHHTNRGLDFGDAEDEEVTGYEIDGAAILGINTPTTRTQLRPRARFQGFQDRSELNNTDYGLDFSTVYQSPRHHFDLIAKGSRRDTLSTEYIEPGFDDFDPDDPTVNDPGRIEEDNSLTRYQLRPTYDFRLTERTRIGLLGVGQLVRFGNQELGRRVDYDYASAGVSWGFQATERTTVFLDPYLTAYDTLDESYTSRGAGAAFGFDHAWSQTYRVALTFSVERDEIERTPFIDTPAGPVAQPRIEEEATNWGALASMFRKGEISSWRLNVGRIISPSTRGTKVEADQVNLQWKRLLTQRLETTVAARYTRERSIGELDLEDDRTHAGADVGLRWMMTERWYLHGSAGVLSQEFERDASSATDARAFMGFGYIGLGPQTGSTD